MTRLRNTFAVLCCLLLSVAASSQEAPVATILGYHEVDDAPTHQTVPRRTATGEVKTEQRRYTVSTTDFEAQLDYLAANGYNVIPLAELVEFLAGQRDAIPPKAVVITVDDGWACTYTNMLPALQKRNMPFTLFVYPRFVGRGSHALTWEQIQELAGTPGVSVQSHGFTHAFLTRQNNADAAKDYTRFLEHELRDSRVKISEMTNTSVKLLAYPFGDYDDEVAAAAAEFGYAGAVTVERGPITRSTRPYRLNRYLLHHDTTLDDFRTFLP